MSSPTEALRGALTNRWEAATTSAFLDRVRDGTLPEAAFDRWLEQDYLFLIALTRSWSRLIPVAPRRDLELLSDGIASFVEEIGWFENVARQRQLTLDGEPMDVSRAYIAALSELPERSYGVAMAGMWATEAVYLEAWSSALPGSPPYGPFVTHWADDAFATFVRRTADVVARELDGHALDEALAVVGHILDLEAAFWDMTLADEG